MDLKELTRKGFIEKVTPDKKFALELIKAADKDLIAAEDNIKIKHEDWALVMAYNAMLSAGRALMAARGYRTFSESHHLAVVQFCATLIPKDSSGLVKTFNRYRVRRHDVIYGETDSVGKDEAKRAIKRAKEFVKKVKDML